MITLPANGAVGSNTTLYLPLSVSCVTDGSASMPPATRSVSIAATIGAPLPVAMSVTSRSGLRPASVRPRRSASSESAPAAVIASVLPFASSRLASARRLRDELIAVAVVEFRVDLHVDVARALAQHVIVRSDERIDALADERLHRGGPPVKQSFSTCTPAFSKLPSLSATCATIGVIPPQIKPTLIVGRSALRPGAAGTSKAAQTAAARRRSGVFSGVSFRGACDLAVAEYAAFACADDRFECERDEHDDEESGEDAGRIERIRLIS